MDDRLPLNVIAGMAGTVIVSVLVIAVAIGLWVANATPPEVKTAQAQVALTTAQVDEKNVQALAPLRMALSAIGMIAGTALAIFIAGGLGLAVVKRAQLWAETVRPVDGLYPVRWVHWPGGGMVIDVNRQPGSVTAYTVGPDGVSLSQPGADDPAQLAVTAGAMAIQRAAVCTLAMSPRPFVEETREPSYMQDSPYTAPSSNALMGSPRWEPVTLPDRVPLRALLPGQPSIERIVLGVAAGTTGSEIVHAPLGDLVHVAVGGSSGWGKSVFLQSLAYQVAASEQAQLALIDLEGVTFSPFERSASLLFPIAGTMRDARTVLHALVEEMEARRAVGDTNARPIAVMIDESTALLDDKSIETELRTLALRARKWGLYLILGGQDWKASSLDTAIRNQLSTRIQFKANSASQSRVLLDSGDAAAIVVKGRALARLPGRPIVEIQAPYIGRTEFESFLTSGVPAREMPVADDEDADEVGYEHDDREDRIRALAAEGLSRRSIERIVFGSTGGAAYEAVRRVLGAAPRAAACSNAEDGGDGQR